MLLHDPYALAKYIAVQQDQLNLRLLRSYLSYLFREEIFNGHNILLFARRTFVIVLESLITPISV
jgi:hypothetical protein